MATSVLRAIVRAVSISPSRARREFELAEDADREEHRDQDHPARRGSATGSAPFLLRGRLAHDVPLGRLEGQRHGERDGTHHC